MDDDFGLRRHFGYSSWVIPHHLSPPNQPRTILSCTVRRFSAAESPRVFTSDLFVWRVLSRSAIVVEAYTMVSISSHMMCHHHVHMHLMVYELGQVHIRTPSSIHHFLLRDASILIWYRWVVVYIRWSIFGDEDVSS